MCVWRPEVEVRTHPQSSSPSFFEAESLNQTLSSQICLDSQPPYSEVSLASPSELGTIGGQLYHPDLAWAQESKLWPSCLCKVLFLFPNLTQPESFQWKELQLRKCPTRLPWLMINKRRPPHYGWGHPGQVVQACIRMQDERAIRSKPLSSVSP